jgi:plasmid maintenance system antidote protein VapI
LTIRGACAVTVTVVTNLRLARFFGTSAGFWTGLQADCDRAIAKEAMADALARIQRCTQGEAHA